MTLTVLSPFYKTQDLLEFMKTHKMLIRKFTLCCNNMKQVLYQRWGHVIAGVFKKQTNKMSQNRGQDVCKNTFTMSVLSFPQLVIRVHLSDESSKTMMVDERQTVRQVLDSLLDKSHCGYSLDWSLVEIISELQMGKRWKTNTCLPFTQSTL